MSYVLDFTTIDSITGKQSYISKRPDGTIWIVPSMSRLVGIGPDRLRGGYHNTNTGGRASAMDHYATPRKDSVKVKTIAEYFAHEELNAWRAQDRSAKNLLDVINEFLAEKLQAQVTDYFGAHYVDPEPREALTSPEPVDFSKVHEAMKPKPYIDLEDY